VDKFLGYPAADR